MYLVTNRKIIHEVGDCSILGHSPNIHGPNELRLVEANKSRGKWKLTVLPDQVTSAMREAAGASDNHVASYVAGMLMDRINPRFRNPRSTAKGRNFVVFVHGFNNDVKDVLERAWLLSRNYGLEVLPFSWPANGGGTVSGTASYKEDKRDARASQGALDRVLGAIDKYLGYYTKEGVKRVHERAEQKFPDNMEQRNAWIAEQLEAGCPFTVNLMAHSMGNYLYKHLLQSSATEGRLMLFDNVVLVAADTNNAGHEGWVDEIRARRRIYLTINEDDSALKASRMKAGEAQQARLGHYPFDLNSKYAAYVQFTGAPKVKQSHSYFEGEPIENPRVKRFFREVLNGRRADSGLKYDPSSNTFRV